MESLNLHTLATSLPMASAQQNAEKELANNFKAAALSLTTLYRSSRKSAKRAYNAGYAAACHDLLTMIQQGVSSSSDSALPGGGLTIGRVMDWTEARLEAIKAREEEEEEEEEKEKDSPTTRTPAPTAPKPDAKPTIAKTVKSKPSLQPLTQPSPSSSSPVQPRPTSHHPQRPQRSARPSPSDIDSPEAPEIDFSIPIAAGAKRRHAMMMMLDTPHPSAPTAPFALDAPASGTAAAAVAVTCGAASGLGPSRRRTRSARQLQPTQTLNQAAAAELDPMEVEEDGRERKRVARR
ncbi:hypothetical protein H0H92_012615 [Tricholoma furcatifolium]|nr:hypothetical protein H0H92_012615 [Tricholoma furcatifolium]